MADGPILIGFGSSKPSVVVPKLRGLLKGGQTKPVFVQIEDVKANRDIINPKAVKIAIADSVSDLALHAKDLDNTFSAVLCFDSPIVLLTVADMVAHDFDPSDKWSLPIRQELSSTSSFGSLAASILERHRSPKVGNHLSISIGPVMSLVEVVDRNTKPSLIGPMSGLLYSMQPNERFKIRESIAHWLLGRIDVKACLKTIATVAAKHQTAKTFADLEKFLLANHETYEREFAKTKKKATTRKGITPFEGEFLRRLITEHSK